ncbi:hypothetical protein [Roseateles sp.]|uniref:hypothetical protein n=1 Tax=Roseateles sp. TaxID=1971397 RepID=UPI003266339E
MQFPSHRRPAALVLFALLAGCGGATNDVADPVVDGFICAFRNCTESSTLNVDEISPRFTATQNDSDRTILVEGGLGKSANVFTAVLPAPGERLSASVDGGTEVTMGNPDGKRLDYSAGLTSASAQPVVRVVFTRAGVPNISEVTMPAGFTVLQPAAGVALARTAGDVDVRLSSTALTTSMADGTCSRTDGSSFPVKNEILPATIQSSVVGGYRLNGAALDDALNLASRSHNNNIVTTPLVSRCQLTVAWRRTAWGTVAPAMNAHGAIGGYRQALQALTYDGQR